MSRDDTLRVRPLGSSGLAVTPLGIGLAAIGRPRYITLGREADLGGDRSIEAMQRRAHAVLDVAYDAGVRYVDVARSYGRAEAFLASWLDSRSLDPGAITIGSKWGYTYVADWRDDATTHEVKDHSLDALRRQIVESRATLGSALRLYQIHSATIESGVLDDLAVLRHLAGLRDGGLAIGLSTSGPAQSATIERALSVSIDGMNPFSVVQSTWNLLEPSAAGALAAAHGAGWGVIVKESLANGRLAPGAGPDRPGGDGRSTMLVDTASRHDIATDQVAIAAALAQPWCDVVLSGAATPDQVHGHLGALDIELSLDDLEALAAMQEDPTAYWARRAELPWS